MRLNTLPVAVKIMRAFWRNTLDRACLAGLLHTSRSTGSTYPSLNETSNHTSKLMACQTQNSTNISVNILKLFSHEYSIHENLRLRKTKPKNKKKTNKNLLVWLNIKTVRIWCSEKVFTRKLTLSEGWNV